jgi:2-dehydro-3-deoxygalactonokinase
MSDFISIDWGTTSLRVSHCTSEGHDTIRSVTTDDGALSVNRRFLAKGDPSPEARKNFFQEVMVKAIQQLDLPSDANLPVLLSGMVSSVIGMETLPYARLPFSLSGSEAMVKKWESEGQRYYMISGLATEEDLMRGEETQLVGASILAGIANEEVLFIFPGTHAKHVQVREGMVKDFKTYMTGEVFCQLFSNSILAQSVSVHHDHNESNTIAFINGVHEGAEGNVLHKMFKVRTAGLFNRMSKEENFSYLSGMLIGAELKDLKDAHLGRIILCGSGELMQAYEQALKALGLLEKPGDCFIADGNTATAIGQYKICQLSSQL